MVVGFTSTYATSVYHYYFCEINFKLWQGAFRTTLCNQVSQYSCFPHQIELTAMIKLKSV